MNNEELKKKIVEIIINAIWKDAEADYDSTDETEAGSIADALIAAGIGDVKDLKVQVDSLEITNIALQAGYDDAEKDRLYWVNKYKEAEHRADVAESALRYACWDLTKYYGAKVRQEWRDLKAAQYKNKAEKELAEEGEDES